MEALRRGLSFAALVFAAACSDPAPPPRPAPPPATYAAAAPREVATAASKAVPVRFVDVTETSGIRFRHDNGARGAKWLPETMGGGVGLFDADGDGDDDVLLLDGGALDGPATGRSKLYRNDGGWRFTDVTKGSGFDVPMYAMGVATADIDADGDVDVFVSRVGGYSLFRNDGGLRFIDTTRESGLDASALADAKGPATPPFPTSAAFLDADRDGRPDLFVAHYVRWSKETDVWATLDGKTKSYAIPDQYQGESCRLWRNLGGGRFEDVTVASGIRNDESKALGVCVLDANGDGASDIFVANDKWANFLFLNDGRGRFRDAALEWNVAYGPDGRARAGMGIDAGCLDERGLPAVAIGNFSNEPVSLFELVRPGGDVFINRADPCGVAALTHKPLTFGLLFADVDLDGFEDLLLANGHIEPTIGEVHKDLAWKQSAQWLRNLGNRKFVDASGGENSALSVPRVGRGLAASDLDGDGDRDFVLVENGGDVVVVRCDVPEGRGLSVKLEATADRRFDPLGARVVVEHADGFRQLRTVRSGSSYLSASTRTLHFGLGGRSPVTKITVDWPSPVNATRSYEGPFKDTMILRP